jgi:hypothetical protein
VKGTLKNFLLLILLALAFLSAGLITGYFYTSLVNLTTLCIVVPVFFFISALSLAIFFNAHKRNPDGKIVSTFVALSLKTLLCLVFALIIFLVFKKKDSGTVILFFIIYLGFTLFVVFSMLNTLKKSH